MLAAATGEVNETGESRFQVLGFRFQASGFSFLTPVSYHLLSVPSFRFSLFGFRLFTNTLTDSSPSSDNLSCVTGDQAFSPTALSSRG